MEEKRGKEKQVAILGCGWLGLPLAEALLDNGFLVKGSTTSVEKIPNLKSKGIQPFLILLSENGPSGMLTDFLANSKILIIDVPPKLRGENRENFIAKMEKILPYIENSLVEKVLFVSSTSVYSDSQANITETTLPNPDTESGRQLLATEKIFLKNVNFETTVLRFGGLIGADRHPIKMLAGRENLENPMGPINFIHQKDCIGIILKIIEKEAWNETFNAVTPYHPSREEYYHKKAVEMNLAIPKFTTEKPSTKKLISSKKIETVLHYTFVVNPL